MKRIGYLFGVWLAWLAVPGAAALTLQVENSSSELFQAVAAVPLADGQRTALAHSAVVELGPNGERLGPVPCVVDSSGETAELLCLLPGITASGATRRFLVMDGTAPAAVTSDLVVEENEDSLIVRNSYFQLRHPRRGGGGLPRGVRFQVSGREDSDLYLLDRIYRRETKLQYLLTSDRESGAKLLFQHPLRVVIESQGRYCLGDGVPAPGAPRARYRFVYSPYSPVIEVTAWMEKDDEVTWDELHFLHLTRQTFHYSQFVTGDAPAVFPMNVPGAKSVARSGANWGVMASAADAAGVGYGRVNCWDASDQFYYYVSRDRSSWTERRMKWAGALYFGPASADPAWYSRWLSGPSLKARMQDVAGAATAPPRVPPPLQGPYELANAAMRVVFAGEDNGFACVGIENRLADNARFVHEREETPGLWRLEFRTPYREVAEGEDGKPQETVILDNRSSVESREAKATQTAEGDLLTFTWRGMSLGGEVDVVDVTATVLLRAGRGESEWRLEIANRSRRFGLWEQSYPLLSCVAPRGTADVLLPSGNWGGQLIRSYQGSFNRPYPSGACPVQFMAFHLGEAGLYLGAHDPGARSKSLQISADQDASIVTSAEDMGVPGSQLAAPFPVVVSVYCGDWWEAARRYRAWASQQAWTAKGWIRDRSDYPQQLADLGFWWIMSGRPEQVQPLMLRAAERCSLSLGLHWYNWHEIPFDHSYPEYFPTKPGFAEATRALVSRGQLIMPYINGRLWDEDIPSFAAGLAGACKQPSGKNYTEVYGSGRKLAPMCPVTKVWQDKVGDICHRLMHECGVNGIYLDQIGAARPRLCFDSSHGHPLGGGRHWVDAYRAMLEPIKAEAVRMNCALTTENTAEPYMDTIDAFLAWSPRFEVDVPLLPAVYSGYTLYFTSPQDAKDDLLAFALAQGRDFLWGCQLGWNGTWLLEPKHAAKLDFMLQASELRLAAKDFTVYGQLLDEIRPLEPVPAMTVTWHRNTAHAATLPSAQGTLWRSADGRLAALFFNAADEHRELAWELVPGDWGLTGDHWLVERLYGQGSVPVEFQDGFSLSRRERLAPYEVRALVFRPATRDDVDKASAVAEELRMDPVRGGQAARFLFDRALAERQLRVLFPGADQLVVRGEPAEFRFEIVSAGAAPVDFELLWPDGELQVVTAQPGQTVSARRVLWLLAEKDGVAEAYIRLRLPAAEVMRGVPVHIRYMPSVSIQMSVPAGVHGGESFLLPLALRNNSRAARSGRLLLQTPAGWRIEPAADMAVDALAPGESQSFLLKCTTTQTNADEAATVSARFVEGGEDAEILLRKSRPVAHAVRVAQPLVIDGHLDDWLSPVQLRLGGEAGGVRIDKDYGGAEDCSAQLRLAWDQDYLYVAAEIDDNVQHQEDGGAQIWRGDCLQLAWRNGAPNSRPGFDGTEHEVGLTLTSAGPLVFQWAPGAAPLSAAKLAVLREGERTIYEAAIPWSALGVKSPRAGLRSAWSMTVNDNDGAGFRGWLEWTPGICGGKDSSLFGWLVLD